MFNSLLELFHAFIFFFPFYFSRRLRQGLSEEKGEEGRKGEREKREEGGTREKMERRKGGKKGEIGEKKGVFQIIDEGDIGKAKGIK